MEVRIIKLRYNSNSEGISDLIAKGVINENQEMINGTQAYVPLDWGCFDLMTTDEIEFEFEVNPVTPNHNFAGHEPITELEPETILSEE